MTKTISFSSTVSSDDPPILIDFLAVRSKLSKVKIKDSINKGALLFKRKGRKTKRLRKAKFRLKLHDFIDFNYSPKLINIVPPEPVLISDYTRYSCWNKPAGLLSQGTKYGDHCSVLRRVELYYKGTRSTYLVHRLDREAQGLICIAHDKETAKLLSQLFKDRKIKKRYLIDVLGDLNSIDKKRVIDQPIDNKKAVTKFKQLAYSKNKNYSTVVVQLEGGRYHQIRRHFAAINHPVIGDPKYGKNNKNQDGLKLCATGLKFICPISSTSINLKI